MHSVLQLAFTAKEYHFLAKEECNDTDWKKKRLSNKYQARPVLEFKNKSFVLRATKKQTFDTIERFFTPELLQDSDIKISRIKGETVALVIKEQQNYIKTNQDSSLMYTYPSNSKQWLEQTSVEVSATNRPKTLLLDLDGTVLSFDKPYHRFTQKISVNEYNFFIDPDALNELKAFQQRGHHIIVITEASYQFQEVETIFKTFGVTLAEECYISRPEVIVAGKGKRRFINNMEFGPESLLIDDKEKNKPKNAHFIQILPDQPFPCLSQKETRDKEPSIPKHTLLR